MVAVIAAVTLVAAAGFLAGAAVFRSNSLPLVVLLLVPSVLWEATYSGIRVGRSSSADGGEDCTMTTCTRCDCKVKTSPMQTVHTAVMTNRNEVGFLSDLGGRSSVALSFRLLPPLLEGGRVGGRAVFVCSDEADPCDHTDEDRNDGDWMLELWTQLISWGCFRCARRGVRRWAEPRDPFMLPLPSRL